MGGEVHAEGHAARAATVAVTDISADDVATGAAELHLTTDGKDTAHIRTGCSTGRPTGTTCCQATRRAWVRLVVQ